MRAYFRNWARVSLRVVSCLVVVSCPSFHFRLAPLQCSLPVFPLYMRHGMNWRLILGSKQ